MSLAKLWVLVRDALFSLCFNHFGLFLGRLYSGFCCLPSVKHLRDTYLGIPWISYYRCRFFFHENILCSKFILFFGFLRWIIIFSAFTFYGRDQINTYIPLMNLYVGLMTGDVSVQVSFDKLDNDTDQTWWKSTPPSSCHYHIALLKWKKLLFIFSFKCKLHHSFYRFNPFFDVFIKLDFKTLTK